MHGNYGWDERETEVRHAASQKLRVEYGKEITVGGRETECRHAARNYAFTVAAAGPADFTIAGDLVRLHGYGCGIAVARSRAGHFYGCGSKTTVTYGYGAIAVASGGQRSK